MSHSRLKADTLAASVLLLMIVTVVQRAVGLGRGVLFCRWLDPETLGQWDMVYSFLLLAAPLAVLGVPGSYGRYLEHFRQRGHLSTFLRRTAVWTFGCTIATVTIILTFAREFSQLLFGDHEHTSLIGGVAICLTAVILQHTLISLFNALRLFRVVSAMNFIQSFLFAGLALGLLLVNASVTSILIGYSIGCVVSSAGAMIWAWPALTGIERPTEHLAQWDFWPRLMRFAFFVWVTNMLSHLFAIVDRYMLVHFSGMDSSEALQQVGYYHSSRVVPLLLISFADVLSGLIMPHLSRDWEAGKHTEVGKQLKLFVKLTGIGMFGFSLCVLLFAPLLFDVILQGKYSDGLDVLPWALTSCVWFSIYTVAQNYLWCAEKTRLATLPLIIGLGVNIGLNLALLPIWGLLGAVVATGISTLVCLGAILLISSRHGMHIDLGLWLIVIAPIAICADLDIAAATFAVLLIATPFTSLTLDDQEKQGLYALLQQFITKTKHYLPTRPTKSTIASS